MKIIVNACPLLNLPTGIGRYIRSLYTQISLSFPEIEIKYFDGTRLCGAMPKPPENRGFWATAVKIAWKLPSSVPYFVRILMHEKNARKFLKLSENFDIYHEAGYFPFKTAKTVKTVFTIHDISLKMLPDFHPKERVRFFNKYFEKSLQFADLIITPSEFTKGEIAKRYPELNIPVCPVPLGYDNALFYPREQQSVDDCKKRFQLPETYILFVGTSDPRKNTQAIIQALQFLPKSVKLVCAGWSGWEQSEEGAGQIASGIENRIIFTGYVTDPDLACLYSGAKVFVYPSIYEGFGLPILEAMACGCPVICSHRASLPEVAGDSALYCDPDDVFNLSRLIQQILDSELLYNEMRAKSLSRATSFTWKQTAEKTMNVFVPFSH